MTERFRRRRIAGLLGLVLSLSIASASGQTLRVTTWSLLPPVGGTNAAAANTNGIRIPAAATALKRIDPDIILLQQVSDWAMCQELAQALAPEKYRVVTCSAFRDGRGGLRKQQTAILARATVRPYFSWSEPWGNRGVPVLPGGFSFAAFQIGRQRVGVFSVQAVVATGGGGGKRKTPPAKQANPATPQERLTATIDHLLAQVGSVTSWVTNRVEALLVGGTYGVSASQIMSLYEEPLQMLEEAGFADVFADTPIAQRGTIRGKGAGSVADYIFAQPGNCTKNPAVQRTQVCRHFPVTCDVQLGLLSAPIEPVKTPESIAATRGAPEVRPAMTSATTKTSSNSPATTASAPTTTNTPTALTATPPAHTAWLSPQFLWITSAAVGLPALVAIALILSRKRKSTLPRTPALLAVGEDAPAAYTVVMGTRSAAESAPPPPGPAPVQPVIHIESPSDTHTQTEALRQRALAAEQQAERARALIRAGLLPDLRTWLKQKLARKLIADRARMIETQQAAARQADAVEQRLARIEQQLQAQNRVYVQRIEELTHELLVAKEENRELIRARIAQVKAEMAAARERLLAQE